MGNLQRKKPLKKMTIRQYSAYDLPYAHNALEPYIDLETMRVHHDVLYLRYVEKLNEALQKNSVDLDILKILENYQDFPATFRNNGGGFVNHSMLWQFLKPNQGGKIHQPTGASKSLIERDFQSFGDFIEVIEDEVINLFGSGWVWWMMDEEGYTNIASMANQDNPYMIQQYPLWGIDVWEHAYFLKFKANRKEYLNKLLHVTNWNYVNTRIQLR
jgi:Fe-Mn family superoxide dismutase